jgi:hypothetical protein
MPRMITVHEVEDVATWLSHKQARAEAVESIGGRDVVDHVALDGSKTVAITYEVDDVDATMARMEVPSAELEAEMHRHGVIPPMRVFVEK